LELDIAVELQDAAQVGQLTTTLELAAEKLPGGAERQSDTLRRKAQIALAFGRVGAAAEAGQRAAALPLDCYPCLRAKGYAAWSIGDRATAIRFFNDAIEQAPSIPFAYLDMGKLFLEAGNGDRALAQFEKANAKGPNWSDPLKLMGDAFARTRDGRKALESYTKAAALSPKWGGLYVAWADTLVRSGNLSDARRKLQAAASMRLSAEDRRKLGVLWRAATSRRQ
jgi:tetratricopeptide (TPR) repeat protein